MNRFFYLFKKYEGFSTLDPYFLSRSKTMLILKRKKIISNEKGAISFEFLGIIPFYFMFFLILWQVVSTGYAVMTAKSAVNEAAKVYAMSEDIEKARNTAEKIVGSHSILSIKDLQVNPHGLMGKDFDVKLTLEHQLALVPKKWRQAAAIDLEEETSSRVMR